MPRALERHLWTEARRRWPRSPHHQARYVFGTMWTIAREKFPGNRRKQREFVTGKRER